MIGIGGRQVHGAKLAVARVAKTSPCRHAAIPHRREPQDAGNCRRQTESSLPPKKPPQRPAAVSRPDGCRCPVAPQATGARPRGAGRRAVQRLTAPLFLRRKSDGGPSSLSARPSSPSFPRRPLSFCLAMVLSTPAAPSNPYALLRLGSSLSP